MKHTVTLALWLVLSLMALGTVSAAIYQLLQGTLYQNGQPVGTYVHRADGKTELHIPDTDKVKTGVLELKGRDGAPLRVFIDKGK